jgi:TrmH family RNA methyltransferase
MSARKVKEPVKLWKDNVSFILVEPGKPGNIGAAARALKNMGFRGLELINPCEFLSEEAKSMACNAGDVLMKARVYPDFGDAVREKNLVIGTTRRRGRQRGLIIPIEDGVKRIMAAAKRNKVGILFGREKNGLTNREVEECSFLMTIPSDSFSPSLNLAQSVMLVAYELGRKSYRAASPVLVKQGELDDLYRHIQTTLRILEYIPRGSRHIEKKIMINLKHLLGRGGLTEWELKMLRGICGQIEKRITSIVSLKEKSEKRIPGTAKGRITIMKDFFSPLPEDMLDEFKK